MMMENSTVHNAEERLRNLVGVDHIIAQFEQYKKDLRAFKLNNTSFYSNMAFEGNPATGKSTVASLFAYNLHEEGLIQSGKIIEIQSSTFVGPFIGESETKARAIFDRAKGGILFINEAHKLSENDCREAYDLLLQFMEHDRDTVIIFSDYPEEMRLFLEGNFAFKNLVPYRFVFEDFTNDQLTNIFKKRIGETGWILDEKSLPYVENYFSSIPRNKHFENIRKVDQLISVLIGRHQRRLIETDNSIEQNKGIVLPQDFPNYEDFHNTKDVERQLQEIGATKDELPFMVRVTQELDEEHDEKKESDMWAKIDHIEAALANMKDFMENIQVNVAMLVQNQASAADVAVLKRENEAFRSDSNMKLMRRYGIDAMIRTYQAICDRVFRIKHTQSEGTAEVDALNWVLKRMEKQLKPLGVKLKSTQLGSPVDDSTMVIYGSDGEDVDDEESIVETEDERLKDTVRESVCPAFVWTIPSLIGDVKEWYMEKEKVCIYK